MARLLEESSSNNSGTIFGLILIMVEPRLRLLDNRDAQLRSVLKLLKTLKAFERLREL
jgi:hypothetical protein